jgi:signal transduction histidine kinase
MAARATAPKVEDSTSPDTRAEVVLRVAALAHGTVRRTEELGLPRGLARAIDDAERRALALARAGGGGDEARRAAALEFLASTLTTVRLAGHGEPGEIGALVRDAAAAVGVSREAASLLVFQRMLAAPDAGQLAPRDAVEHVLDLVVELGTAEAVSLWKRTSSGRLECVAEAGAAATTRRLRGAARTLLTTGRPPVTSASHVRAVVVERWDQPHAALVGRSRPIATPTLTVYLEEAAAALAPVFGREALFERNAERERRLVAASERRIARLGCDLHDGPLQEIVAFAADLRFARAEIASLLPYAARELVEEPFDQLIARLESLDRSLRHVSHAVRSTMGVERPLEQVIRSEVDAFEARGSTAATFNVEGDLSELTDSQKIVLLRVAQEALANARKHSRASRVDVQIRATRSYVSLLVADDGDGFDVEEARRKGRLGLSGVIERVHLLGGAVEIESEPGCGTQIRTTLPRWAAPEETRTTTLYAVTA